VADLARTIAGAIPILNAAGASLAGLAKEQQVELADGATEVRLASAVAVAVRDGVALPAATWTALTAHAAEAARGRRLQIVRSGQRALEQMVAQLLEPRS
jgi:hypothetical protein